MPNIALELGKQSASFGVHSAYGEQQDVDGIRSSPSRSPGRASAADPTKPATAGAGAAAGRFPLGAYIRKGDDLRFEPNIVSLLAVAIPFVLFAGRALSRVIRALKK